MITPGFSLTATERVLPSLALDFTTAILDPRVTVARAGATATRVNSSGYIETVAANTPRFDYNPTSLVCEGLLIEQANTNSVTYSEQADLRFGSAFAAINLDFSANAAAAPDNQQTADLCIPTTTNSTHAIRLAGLNTGQVLSVFAYNPSAVNYTIELLSGAVSTIFNISAGTVVSGTGEIKAYKNGFYRVSITGTSNSSAYIFIRKDGASSYAGDGTTGVYLWGCQITAGPLTSYIPTNGATSTRNADAVSMTGTNFSSWYTSSSAALAAVVIPITATGTRPIWQLDDTTANEIIALRGNVANPELYIVDGGVPQAQLDAGTITANTQYGLCAAFAANSCAVSQNGAAPVTTATATIPTVTQARIGSDGSNFLNGAVRTLRYWPQRVLNAETQAFSK